MSEHSIGITKGIPLDTSRRDPKDPQRTIHEPRWHGNCSCGWTGDDTSAEVAQSDALSHQAGRPIRRTRLTTRVISKKRDPWMGGHRVYDLH